MAKRHHYVPVTYLRRFTGSDGHLLAYRKDEPARVFRQRPEATAFERYYYSQVADDGTRDDDRMEALFSEVESDWPSIVESLKRRETMFRAAPQIIVFLALMRVRGPAFRDAVELQLAELVHAEARVMNDAGMLPPMPEGHEDLLEKMVVTIDPHQSLVAMAETMNDIGRLFSTLSYDVLHNDTGISFLTSDNPVMYFDPAIPVSRMRPYTVRPAGRVELLFPVTPCMMLRGRSSPARKQIGHKPMNEKRWVNRANRLIARFAYRTVFASQKGADGLIARNAAVSPVPRFDRVPTPQGGYYSFSQFVFGPRPIKPKW